MPIKTPVPTLYKRLTSLLPKRIHLRTLFQTNRKHFHFYFCIHPCINISILTVYQKKNLPRYCVNKLCKCSDSTAKLGILWANFMFLSQYWRSIRKLLFCQLSHLAKQLQFINSVECEWINMFHWAMCHLLIGYWWDYWRAAN